jgi:hypothetical protein
MDPFLFTLLVFGLCVVIGILALVAIACVAPLLIILEAVLAALEPLARCRSRRRAERERRLREEAERESQRRAFYRSPQSVYAYERLIGRLAAREAELLELDGKLAACEALDRVYAGEAAAHRERGIDLRRWPNLVRSCEVDYWLAAYRRRRAELLEDLWFLRADRREFEADAEFRKTRRLVAERPAS